MCLSAPIKARADAHKTLFQSTGIIKRGCVFMFPPSGCNRQGYCLCETCADCTSKSECAYFGFNSFFVVSSLPDPYSSDEQKEMEGAVLE